MSTDTIAVTPIPSNPHSARRIAASALGVRLCERCRPMVCDACKTLAQTDPDPEWVGGRGWVTFWRCHEVDGCISRGGVRA